MKSVACSMETHRRNLEDPSVTVSSTDRGRALVSLVEGWADLDLAALARAVEVTGATGGVIAVVHDGRLVVIASEGVAPPFGADISLGDTMLDHVRVAGGTLVLSTAEAVERFPAMRTFAPAGLGWAAGPMRM